MSLREPLWNGNHARDPVSEKSELACVQALTRGADAASPPISHGPEWEAASARIKAGCGAWGSILAARKRAAATLGNTSGQVEGFLLSTEF